MRSTFRSMSMSPSRSLAISLTRRPAEYARARATRCLRFLGALQRRMASSFERTPGSFRSALGRRAHGAS